MTRFIRINNSEESKETYVRADQIAKVTVRSGLEDHPTVAVIYLKDGEKVSVPEDKIASLKQELKLIDSQEPKKGDVYQFESGEILKFHLAEVKSITQKLEYPSVSHEGNWWLTLTNGSKYVLSHSEKEAIAVKLLALKLV